MSRNDVSAHFSEVLSAVVMFGALSCPVSRCLPTVPSAEPLLHELWPPQEHSLAAVAVILEARLSFQFKASDEVRGSAENCTTGFCAIELIASKWDCLLMEISNLCVYY